MLTVNCVVHKFVRMQSLNRLSCAFSLIFCKVGQNLDMVLCMIIKYPRLLYALNIFNASYINFLLGYIKNFNAVCFLKMSQSAIKFEYDFKVRRLNVLRVVIVSCIDFTEAHQKFKHLF